MFPTEPMLEYARAMYPGSPCAHRESITVAHDLGPNQLGWAHTDGTCRVALLASLDPEDTCSALIHELGHLAGHQHTATGPMAPTLTPNQGCYERFGSQYERAVKTLGQGTRCSWARNTPKLSVVYSCRHTRLHLRVTVTQAGHLTTSNPR